jgi:hypothetical protein
MEGSCEMVMSFDVDEREKLCLTGCSSSHISLLDSTESMRDY